MGSKYVSQATSGYDASPPPDDGTQVAANLISWSAVKTKLTNVLKTFAEAINTALVSTLDLSARAIGSNDTAVASDHWKTLQVTGATTITLSSAASMGAGYEVGIFNAGASTVTVTPGLASDTINNVSASVTIPIKGTMIFRTNQALTGYNIVGKGNIGQWGTGVENFGTIAKRKTADESIASSAALQDDDHLTFAIAANEEWIVTIEFTATSTNFASGGIVLAVTVPAGATLRASSTQEGNIGSAADLGRTVTASAGALTYAAASFNALTTNFVAHISIWVLNSSTAGSVTLQHAQETSNATGYTAVKGSFLQATRIA